MKIVGVSGNARTATRRKLRMPRGLHMPIPPGEWEATFEAMGSHFVRHMLTSPDPIGWSQADRQAAAIWLERKDVHRRNSIGAWGVAGIGIATLIFVGLAKAMHG
jgi:hypothetical protein